MDLFESIRLNHGILRKASNFLAVDRRLQVMLGSILVATRREYFADSRLFCAFSQSCGPVDCFDHLVRCDKIGLPPDTDEQTAEYLAMLATWPADANPVSLSLPHTLHRRRVLHPPRALLRSVMSPFCFVLLMRCWLRASFSFTSPPRHSRDHLALALPFPAPCEVFTKTGSWLVSELDFLFTLCFSLLEPDSNSFANLHGDCLLASSLFFYLLSAGGSIPQCSYVKRGGGLTFPPALPTCPSRRTQPVLQNSARLTKLD